MDIVVLGPKGGETKVVLNDGSGLQKNFLDKTFVKKALGPPAQQIITQTSVGIMKRQKELEKERDFEKSQQQTLRSKNEEIQNLDERWNKEQAIVEQLKENQGSEDEIKRKDELIKNLKKRFEKQEKGERRTSKKNQKMKKRDKRRSTNFNQAFMKKKEKEMSLKKIFTAQKLLMI